MVAPSAQGASGAIKTQSGYAPFREVGKFGLSPLGGAVITGAGKLPFKSTTHVAGISGWRRSSERSIRDLSHNAIALVAEQNFESMAFPLIGAGPGTGSADDVLLMMQNELKNWDLADSYASFVSGGSCKKRKRRFYAKPLRQPVAWILDKLGG